MDPTPPEEDDAPTGPRRARIRGGDAPPAVLGSYQIVGELGRGGMGVVLLGRDRRLQREVAIKMLPSEVDRDPTARELLLAEARALAAINHPNIAIIHSLEEDAGRHFLTMERIEGQSLRTRLRDGPLAVEEALAISRQVARALEAAHEKGVVHRDLKPSNVMLRLDGKVKVLDFGLALRLDRPGAEAAADGELVGTPGYMSPEQVRGEVADARSDVWALGVLFRECLAGRPLVAGASDLEKFAATLKLDPLEVVTEPLPCGPLSPRMVRFLARCLSGPASQRFASMHEARLVLEEEIAERSLPPGTGTAAAAASSHPGNLPYRLTRFVGREREVESAARLLREHRLLTITGPGGCGKSRLALVLAMQHQSVAPDGAWLVELASLEDPARLTATVRAALGAPHDARADAVASLLEYVGEKRLLLVLDNTEHLLHPCAQLVARLLATCPNARVLATSREALRAEGESVFELPPLGLPASASRAPGSAGGRSPTPAPSRATRVDSVFDVEQSDAVQLFLDRARAVLPGFALEATNRQEVAEICRRLDGIPLAIELAAARMKLLSVHKILELLDDRFRLLTRGTRAAQPHQQTLRTLIDWSYDRLEPGERAVLRRLSVFRGAWTLEGVEAVVGGGEVTSWDALDLFTRLVEKSLVVRDLDDAGAGTARYSLLESIRAYAQEKLLEDSGESAEASRRHREYIVSLAIEGFEGLKSASQAKWTVRLDDAVNDVRAVLASLEGDAQGAAAHLRLTGAYGFHWMKRGMWAEGREALERSLARPDADRTSAPYGQALVALGNLEYRSGELVLAREHYESAVSVLRSAGSELQLANATMNLGNVEWSRSDLSAAQQWYETSLEHYRSAGSAVGAAGCLSNLGALAIAREEFDRVESVQSEALAIFEPLGLTENICLSLFQLGIAALTREEYDLARARFQRALNLSREADNRWNIIAALDNLAGVENFRNRPEAARKPLTECLLRLRDMPDPILGVSALENTAAVILGTQPAASAVLLAAAGAERVRHQMPGLSYERRRIEQRTTALRALLGEAGFASAVAEGGAFTLAEALARAEAALEVGPEAGLEG